MTHVTSSSINKDQYSTKLRGFGVIEVIVTSALLALLVTSIFGALVFINRTQAVAGAQSRAVLVAQEGLEAVRNIRDQDFSNLSDGTFGLAVTSDTWTLTGSSDLVEGFERTITISEVDENTKAILSRVEWDQYGASYSRELSTQLTYWQEEVPVEVEDCLIVEVSGASFNGSKKVLQNIFMENICLSQDITIAYVTVTWTAGGKIDKYKFQPTTIWSKNSFGTPSGTQLSGTELDIVDYSLSTLDGSIENVLTFDSKMDGQTFTITYKMSDESVVTVSDITP